MKREPLYTETGRVGAVLEDTTVTKWRPTEAQHMLKHPAALKGWAFDKVIIEQAVSLGATDIHIWARDTDNHYRISMEDFMGKKILLDRRHGKQYLLPLRYWNPQEVDPEPPQARLF